MVKQRYDMEDEQQRVEFIHEAVRVLQKMNPVEADIYIKKLSAETGISEGAIRFEYTGNTSQDSGGSAHEAYDRTDHRTERFGSDGRSGREESGNEPDRAGSDQADAPGCPIHGTAGGCSRTGFRQ